MSLPLQHEKTDESHQPAQSNESTGTGQQQRWTHEWKNWRALLSLFGNFLLMFNSWGLVNSYGTFASYYQQHLAPGHDLLRWNLVGSTQSFVVLILSFVVGRICDANHSRQLIALGGTTITASMFILSAVNGDGNRGDGNYGAIWAVQGFLQGLGMSCFFVTSSQVAATWFVLSKPTAIGVVASGASISGFVYPFILTECIEKLGFNNAVRAVAGLVGFTCLLSFLFATPNPKHNHRKPEKWLRTEVWFDVSAFSHAPFVWLTASICLMFFGFYAIFFNLEGWAAHYGFGRRYQPPGLEITIPDEMRNDSIDTFWLLAILNASSTIGRLSSGWLSKRYGTLVIHSTTMILGSLLTLILWPLATTLGPALAFIIIFGAISGAIIGMPPASCAWVLEQVAPDHINRLGQWVGMMYSCSAVFALTGPVIAGHLISEYRDNYLTVQLWSGFCLFLAGVCMAVALYSTQEGKRKVNKLKMSLSLSRPPTMERNQSA